MASKDPREEAARELRRDFRERLAFLYARLQLAPPYHTVELAVALLAAKVKAGPAEESRRLLEDPSRRWTLYRESFVEAGLNQKHRGIIAGLIRSGRTGDVPHEYETLLDTYLS